MKKEVVQKIVEQYLKLFPDEKQRVAVLQRYLKNNDENSLCDWNNVNGHLTAGGFLYSKETKRFLVLWHKDLKMYLYPGGHCENKNESPMETAKAEVEEETGITRFAAIDIFNDPRIPLDIDTHKIPYNSRVNMPEHFHFDFRYLFVVESEKRVIVDTSELGSYKWISKEDLSGDKNFGKIVEKLDKLI